MLISLLVPSRERPELIKRFMESLWTMTLHKKDVEILFILDDDDTATHANITSICASYQSQYHNIRILTRPRSEFLNEDYYNFAARQAVGDLIWVLADDLEIVAPRWDETVVQEATNFAVKYPDKIFCISLLDNTKPPSHRLPKFPCFPMFTKECLPALGGWILHPKVPTWGCDFVSYCIFEPMGRLLQLHNKVFVNHISWHTKQVGIDHINHRIGDIFNRLKMVPHHNTDRIIAEEVPNIRMELREKIANFYNRTAKEMFKENEQ